MFIGLEAPSKKSVTDLLTHHLKQPCRCFFRCFDITAITTILKPCKKTRNMTMMIMMRMSNWGERAVLHILQKKSYIMLILMFAIIRLPRRHNKSL